MVFPMTAFVVVSADRTDRTDGMERSILILDIVTVQRRTMWKLSDY